MSDAVLGTLEMSSLSVIISQQIRKLRLREVEVTQLVKSMSQDYTQAHL